MKKILTLGLICLVMVSFVLSAEKKREITISWQELFPDHLERVYIIMKDGAIIQHSSQDDFMVDISIGRLKEELKNRDCSIKDIAVVIHNHRYKKEFSRGDYRQYWTLKDYGFDGQFLLYCHRTKEVYDIEEKEKSRKRAERDAIKPRILLAGKSRRMLRIIPSLGNCAA